MCFAVKLGLGELNSFTLCLVNQVSCDVLIQLNQIKMSLSNIEEEPDLLVPRLCHLKLWEETDWYGFSLASKLRKTGHFIVTIDKNSPASVCGLRRGDKIIEVNGTNITGFSHSQVAELIKASENCEVQVLVTDEATEEFFHSKGIKIDSDSVYSMYIEGPSSKPPIPDFDVSFDASFSSTVETIKYGRSLSMVDDPSHIQQEMLRLQRIGLLRPNSRDSFITPADQKNQVLEEKLDESNRRMEKLEACFQSNIKVMDEKLNDMIDALKSTVNSIQSLSMKINETEKSKKRASLLFEPFDRESDI